MLAKPNVALIGMPGAGKSTVGRKLAQHYHMHFFDGDALIEQAAGLPVQQVLERWGMRGYCELESRVLRDLDTSNAVISTGGSAVLSSGLMPHLALNSVRLYLKISPMTLVRRVKNTRTRGLVKHPSHHLLRLYQQREPLYARHGDITFNNDAYFSATALSQLCQLLES